MRQNNKREIIFIKTFSFSPPINHFQPKTKTKTKPKLGLTSKHPITTTTTATPIN